MEESLDQKARVEAVLQVKAGTEEEKEEFARDTYKIANGEFEQKQGLLQTVCNYFRHGNFEQEVDDCDLKEEINKMEKDTKAKLEDVQRQTSSGAKVDPKVIQHLQSLLTSFMELSLVVDEINETEDEQEKCSKIKVMGKIFQKIGISVSFLNFTPQGLLLGVAIQVLGCVMESTPEIVNKSWHKVGSVCRKIGSAVVQTTKNVVDTITEVVSNTVTQVKDFAKTTVKAAASLLIPFPFN